MSGKGSKQRPTNLEAFRSNYDAIFGNKDNTEQVLTEFVSYDEDSNLNEVDQESKLINE